MLLKYVLMLAIVFGMFVSLDAQDKKIRWQRSRTLTEPDLQLFHSTQSVNLPTAETLQKGDFEFEISHRFFPTINEGPDTFYGLDGPVNMRLALGYAINNRMIVTLGRSNVSDNVDLQFKYKFLQLRGEKLPVLVAGRVGAAWNTEVGGRDKGDPDNFQYYGQLIINTLIKKRFGIGVVPSYLYNSNIYDDNVQDSFTMGLNGQYYVSSVWSVLAEWNPTVTGWRSSHNPVSFGIELETGGHFFKIILTNSYLLNPSQFLTGADIDFNDTEWRIGFNITRLLKFSKN
ncbi:MAG: DUF5777 family beta-barrel protein [Calditrichaceae bacterium]